MFFLIVTGRVEAGGGGGGNGRLNWFYFQTCILSYYAVILFDTYDQCWGKLLLKVMHYNIALLSKKVTNYIT